MVRLTQGQIVALVWGPFAIVLGLVFVAARDSISRAARSQRERRGRTLSPSAQSPRQQAMVGVLFVIAGVGAIVGALTGVLH